MGKAEQWCEKMCEFLKGKKLEKTVNFIKGPSCVYGVGHFCDGRPNLSAGKERKKKPCRYYIDGRCTKREKQSD